LSADQDWQAIHFAARLEGASDRTDCKTFACLLVVARDLVAPFFVLRVRQFAREIINEESIEAVPCDPHAVNAGQQEDHSQGVPDPITEEP
jgi:hypothetical protein